MSDLVEFLLARLDEDEGAARAATPGPWRHNPDKHHHIQGTPLFEEAVFAGPPGGEAVCVAGTGETDDQQSMRDATHIARHDPAHVLCEVEAKRRIIERYERAVAIPRSVSSFVSGQDDGYRQACLDAIKDAAEVYVAHTSYREEWKP